MLTLSLPTPVTGLPAKLEAALKAKGACVFEMGYTNHIVSAARCKALLKYEETTLTEVRAVEAWATRPEEVLSAVRNMLAMAHESKRQGQGVQRARKR